jgi:hypothetical protein
MKKYFFTAVLFLTLFVVLPGKANAGEGVVELRSNTIEDYRCYIFSQRLQSRNYAMLVGCRDLIYPPGDNLNVYALWSNPADGSNPVKIGELGFGRMQFSTSKAFSSLFVTTEARNYRTPSERVVMRGNLSSIDFLDRPAPPTPTPEPERIDEIIDDEEEPLSTRQRLALGLRRAGLVALVALVALIGLIFVITRSRG